MSYYCGSYHLPCCVILMGAFQKSVDSDGVIWFELVFWPFITIYAFTDAMRINIMRAIKERKK